ncbi:MAG TPA: c-type cytochrome [Longimicrobiales bacterium]|nr:c-type cytochrome [Longimicrobiales bacterium]
MKSFDAAAGRGFAGRGSLTLAGRTRSARGRASRALAGLARFARSGSSLTVPPPLGAVPARASAPSLAEAASPARSAASPARSAASLLMTAFLLGPTPSAAQQEHPGEEVYARWCAGCHGVDGAGDGPSAAYMLPRPRDFTQALYQIRTTPSGALPTDADMLHVIDYGMPGTAMPGWRELLSSNERQALVDYLKTFSRFFDDDAPDPIDFGRAPGPSEERLAEGRELYDRVECWKCHGPEGRGDGQSAPTQTDDNDHPIRPADLTENWLFNGGGSVADIYRRFRTGLDGTPMPSYSDLLEADVATEEQLWSLALYVRSLAPEEAPRVREVVRAARTEGELPAAGSDSAWADVESFYIPLVGQIIEQPRWFSPGVDGVWVQALHDGSELVMRLTWSDPSRSPDPVWASWQSLVWNTMQPREGDAPDPSLPDAIAVQFPRSLPQGMERPYFLMGTSREPVYLWHWTSTAQAPVEALGRGLGRIEPLPGASTIRGSAEFDSGRWTLVLRRALATAAGDADRIAFPVATAIPVAFFAWDGSNGETGKRLSVSSWYYVYLDEPASPVVYAIPVGVALIAAALLFFLVSRAQRRAGHDASRAPTPALGQTV